MINGPRVYILFAPDASHVQNVIVTEAHYRHSGDWMATGHRLDNIITQPIDVIMNEYAYEGGVAAKDRFVMYACELNEYIIRCMTVYNEKDMREFIETLKEMDSL